MEFNIIEKFNIRKERETYANVKESIDKGVTTKGTNLWILFFAILIASLGLNINSTAVVIGAMLISPLIGPIVGVGFGVATNDLSLIKTGIISYLFSTVVGILASAVYFLITPIDDAHSELLARISPTIYDVLIALFGGFAGVIAISSKQKGNVIPGVAIATAIMPPLCTAGYGLATGQMNFFFGAFYLFIINSVFICAATIVTTGFLRFRKKKYDDPVIERRERFILWSIILLTLIPSIYLGYLFVQKNEFVKSTDNFINQDAQFSNNFLIKKEIDPDTKTITLTYGGRIIQPEEIEEVRKKLVKYDLQKATLVVKNGFAIDTDLSAANNAELQAINRALLENSVQNRRLSLKIDSLENIKLMQKDIITELKVLFPEVVDGLISQQELPADSTGKITFNNIVLLTVPKRLVKSKRETIVNWLKTRMKTDFVELVVKDN